jgi:hypothetical protein
MLTTFLLTLALSASGNPDSLGCHQPPPLAPMAANLPIYDWAPEEPAIDCDAACREKTNARPGCENGVRNSLCDSFLEGCVAGCLMH